MEIEVFYLDLNNRDGVKASMLLNGRRFTKGSMIINPSAKEKIKWKDYRKLPQEYGIDYLSKIRSLVHSHNQIHLF